MAPLTRRKILMIDDDSFDHEIVARTIARLSHLDIDLIYSQTLEEGIRVLSETPVDLILLDNNLGPEIDIRSSLPRLREAGYTNPIGILSSDVENDTVDQFVDLGADFRISKDEFDGKSVQFLIAEFSRRILDDACDEDYAS